MPPRPLYPQNPGQSIIIVRNNIPEPPYNYRKISTIIEYSKKSKNYGKDFPIQK